MSKFSVILVDMGGVLLDHEHALRETTKKLEIPYKRFKNEINKIYARCETDGTTIDEFWRYLLKRVDSTVRVQEYKNVYNANHIKNVELFNFLKKLNDRGIKLGLSTNNIKNHLTDLDNIFGFLKLFEWVFDSSEMNVRKPEREYFEKILKTTKVPKNDVFFIDDRLDYLKGAKSFGFKVFHFSDFRKSTKELRKVLKYNHA